MRPSEQEVLNKKQSANKKQQKLNEADDKPLPPVEATKYRGLAARLNYLAQDRSDLQFSGKELARGMQSPTAAIGPRRSV